MIKNLNRHYLITLRHHDLPSLFAGKLHACFYREYLKGRDWYDFIWYLGRAVLPNFTFLNSAILQSQGADPHLDRETFGEFLAEGLKKTDFKQASADVRRFLIDESELDLFDREKVLAIVRRQYEIKPKL